MTMTDPIADMLTRLRNANSAHHDSVSLPCSKLKTHIAEILKARGLHRRLEGRGRPRRQDPHHRRSSTARTASGRSPASSASPSPACACTRSRPRPAEGPRWPRRRDPVHLLRSADRPSGRARRAWVGKSSPTCGKESDMSRIGRLPIDRPRRASTSPIDGQTVTVKGPKGELTLTVAEPIEVELEENQVLEVTRPDDERDSRSLHGLTRTLINNKIIGVTEGYTKRPRDRRHRLPRAARRAADLEFALGFSHPVPVEPPAGITFTVEGNQTRFTVQRHRQAGRRRGRCEHPQDPQARALQGQGCALRRRGRPPQGRKGW